MYFLFFRIKCSWHPSDSPNHMLQCCQGPMYSMREFMVNYQLIITGKTGLLQCVNSEYIWSDGMKVNNKIFRSHIWSAETNNFINNMYMYIESSKWFIGFEFHTSEWNRHKMKIKWEKWSKWKKVLNHKSWIAVPAIYCVSYLFIKMPSSLFRFLFSRIHSFK